MEKIKTETLDLNPSFWKEFSLISNNALSLKSLDVKGYATLFDLLIFIINRVNMVYSEKCENYLEILNILSVYSILCREFIFQINNENIDSVQKSDFITNFVSILSSNDLYVGLLTESENKNNLIDKNSDVLINRVKKLYFNLIKII